MRAWADGYRDRGWPAGTPAYLLRGYPRMLADTGDASLIWEGHKAGVELPYCQLEKLHALETLPPTGFTIVCFPVTIAGASAGWSRVVALLDD